MCWCRPYVRTPCCGTEECHDMRPRRDRPCMWCECKPAAAPVVKPAPLTPAEVEQLQELIRRNEWNDGQTYAIYARVLGAVITERRLAAGLPPTGLY